MTIYEAPRVVRGGSHPRAPNSGAGTNLKVGDRSRAKVGGGAPIRREKKIFGHARPLFGSKSTICRFCERFRDGQYCFVSFFFAVLLLTVPPRAQPFVKVGVGHVSHVSHGVGATGAKRH